MKIGRICATSTATCSEAPNRYAALPRSRKRTAEQTDATPKANRYARLRTAFVISCLPSPISQADQWLASIAYTLHQQHDHSRNIADRRIAGHSDISAKNHGALIEQDQGDIGRIGQAKRRKADSQNTGHKIASVSVKLKRGSVLFENKEYKADQKGHRLTDCCGNSGSHHPQGSTHTKR